MNGRPKNPKYARNKNILVVGGSGSGFRVIIMTQSNSQVNTRVLELLPKF